MNVSVDGAAIRRTLLEVLQEKQASAGSSLQQNSILSETSRRLGNLAVGEQQALLTLWYDLFRSGQVAWGYNLSNPDPPFCHLTEQGRRTLEHLSRDPSNPGGYRAHLKKVATLNPVAEVYVDEAVTTYNANCFRAAAVMIGVAAESIALELRDTVSRGIQATSRSVPRDLTDFRIKRVLDALQKELEGQSAGMPHDLREDFQAYWPAFTQQVRTVRNDAGHPVSVDRVTPDAVHASLLTFPELARLATRLQAWAPTHYT